jgi:integrase
VAKSGSIYKQKNSKFWWVKYYLPGNPNPIRESTKTENEDDAQNYLWRRLGDVGAGKFLGLEPEKILVNELFDMLVEEYTLNGRASLRELNIRLNKSLRKFFGGLRAATVGTRQVQAYILKRKKEGVKNATVNRELEHLRRAFKLGFEAEPQLVLRPLKYKKLTEDNVREGLLEHDKYLALRAGLPEPYRTLFVCGYHLGTREGELLKLQWSEVDFDRKEITLKRYTTKNKSPRVLPIYGDMEPFLRAAREVRDRLYPECPWVFQRKGEQFIFGHRVWKGLVKRLGAEGLIFHDLRRTAATNMIDAGFSEKEAMAITGHKTDKMFRRYHIIRRHKIQGLGERMGDFYKVRESQIEEAEKAKGAFRFN